MQDNEAEEVQNIQNEAEVTDEVDVETLRKSLAEEKEKAEGYLANWQRSQADFINYKRRIEQGREDFNKFARSALILSLLPILDDLERAFAAIPHRQDKLAWVEGIRMVERKLRTSLEAQGLTPIQARGEPFDPNYHEAARQGKGEEGLVVEEVRRGYMLHDKVLRPTMVVVGNGEKEEN